MNVANAATDVITYWVLRDSTTHAPITTPIAGTDQAADTATAIDLYYVEEGAAIATKIDAVSLGSANAAHADGKVFHVGQGLYRIDWPDAAFDGGVGKKVQLIVVCASVDSTFLEVQLSAPVSLTAVASAALVDEIWDEVLTAATHNVAGSAGKRLRTASGGQLDAGTAQAGGADSITLATSASTTAGLYVGCQIAIDGGTGVGQSRYIVGYTTGRVAYVARHWTTPPDNTSTYVLYADNQVAFIHMGLAQGGGASSITLAADASATDSIYVGQQIRITSGLGDDQVRMITAYNGTSKVATVDRAWQIQPDNTSYYGTLQTGTAYVATQALAALAQMNAEIVDALATDTYAESGAVPAATATLAAKIVWLATLARNKVTQDATTQRVRNDADGADIATAAVSDSGTVFTRGEWT